MKDEKESRAPPKKKKQIVFEMIEFDKLPNDEIWFVRRGKVIGKIKKVNKE